MNENSEETGKWIILNFFPYSPVEVYGLFDTEEEARAYAEQQGMAMGDNSYSVHMVINAHCYEDPSDYVGMGLMMKDETLATKHDLSITVRVRNVYGNKTVYPVCDAAKLFARMAGHSTLTHTTIDLIKKLGYVVEVEQTEPVTL